MKVITTTKYLFESCDYEFIRKQLKEKKIKVKTICNLLGISRNAFYEMVNGKIYASKGLLNTFNTYGILLPLNVRRLEDE